MEIDGNLLIRCHERGSFEVSLVPAGPRSAAVAPIRRLADVGALRRLLTGLGLERDQIDEVLASRYVLQSLRVRVDRRVAGRLGLIPTTPLRRVLDALVEVVARAFR